MTVKYPRYCWTDSNPELWKTELKYKKVQLQYYHFWHGYVIVGYVRAFEQNLKLVLESAIWSVLI